MNVGVTLAELVAPWVKIKNQQLACLVVSDIKIDSRAIKPGTGFLAVKGHTSDGRDFISQSIDLGASYVISDADCPKQQGSIKYHNGIPILSIYRLGDILSELACRFYPLGSLRIIGTTGTNGKTTVAHLVAQWLQLLGQSVSVIGTIGHGFLNRLEVSNNTTESAIDMASLLARYSLEADYASIEVSSHGLVQGRVKAIPFSVGIFTNLSHDHLDYHGTMESYMAAKKLLFTDHYCAHSVINADDSTGQKWLELLDSSIGVSLYPHKKSRKVTLWADHVSYSAKGVNIDIDGQFGKGSVCAPLIGEFNASNLLLGLAALLVLGFKLDALLTTAPNLTPVSGRMELFSAVGKPQIVVDYAHTPDALEKALSALRLHCNHKGKVWVVFGCGGDRDITKRPIMAGIANRLADHIVLCDDNPRSEPAGSIIKNMLDGLDDDRERVRVIHSRLDALLYAFACAEVDDIILLAGKGHESYQAYQADIRYHSDREAAAAVMGMEL